MLLALVFVVGILVCSVVGGGEVGSCCGFSHGGSGEGWVSIGGSRLVGYDGMVVEMVVVELLP